jgi:hypothetical protein
LNRCGVDQARASGSRPLALTAGTSQARDRNKVLRKELERPTGLPMRT